MFDALNTAMVAFNTAMDAIDDPNLKKALIFTLLDAGAEALGTTTLNLLDEHMDIIKEVNAHFGTL